MTYHPIDKPTEPGWYWCLQPSGKFEALEVLQGMTLTGGAPVLCIMPIGQGIIPVEDLDGWFGPAIQTPEIAKSSGNSPSAQNWREAPRRFRWQSKFAIAPDTEGFGLYDSRHDEYIVLLSCGATKCFKGTVDFRRKYFLREWLD